ncbi:MAG: alanine dehydrogenase [Bacteroidetes bacterium]|nr:MAG: alanine dehydrogenase [Bacteroidota bacterium]
MRIGILREGKVPPDERVPFTPRQCTELKNSYPDLDIIIQPSKIRAYRDKSYLKHNITLQEDLSDCDVLMGVKEVNIKDLIPNKKYIFFSHTYKMQPYNRPLLQAILEKNIQLIDYELLTDKNNRRLVAFGYYAGIVGAYNGLRGWGEKHGSFSLKPAYECHNKVELIEQLKIVRFRRPTKILITGHGRVATGAVEILESSGIEKVSVDDYLNNEFDKTVYAQAHVGHYNKRKSDGGFDHDEFYADPNAYVSDFIKFAQRTNLFIACHYWDSKAPFLFKREDAKAKDFKIKMVADISCDIDGPVASTLRPSTIASPFYGYDPINEKECDFLEIDSIGVMAVDNLPCELPRDASDYFGTELIKNVIPALMGDDPDRIIERASETNLSGELMPDFKYLEAYLEGKS